MSTFLEYFNIGIAVNVVVFVVTLVFSQKIKDWINGIPSDLRAGLSKIESATVSQVKAAQTSVVASLTPAPAAVVKPAVVSVVVPVPQSVPPVA
jgi:hypothetical protein